MKSTTEAFGDKIDSMEKALLLEDFQAASLQLDIACHSFDG